MEVCSHNHLTTLQDRRDPTRTLSIRNAFVREMRRRFNKIASEIRKAIVDEDVFGLRETLIEVNQTPGFRRYQFGTSQQKVSQFMAWLRNAIQQDIIEIVNIEQAGTAVNAAWTNIYVQDAYKKGVSAARANLRKKDRSIPTLDVTGGIEAALSAPAHADRLGLLFTRTFNELKGVTDAMDQHISRVLTEAFSRGENPIRIAQMLNATIKGGGGDLGISDILGRYIPASRRAEMIARTEIIRAHAEASLQEYENWRVEGVELKAELITAGDNRVCPECLGYEGQTFSIERARGIIPIHPSCFSKDTEVYTENGWKLFTEIDIHKDLFFSYSINEDKTEFVKAKGSIESECERLLHFKNDKIDIIVTANHKMLCSFGDEKQLIYAYELTEISKFYFYVGLEMSQITVNSHSDIALVDYDDMVYCVELEKNHTLLVRRNGKVMWSGNCRCTWVAV